MSIAPAKPFAVRVHAVRRERLKNRPAPAALRDFGITELTQQQSVTMAVRAYLDQDETLPASPVGRTAGVSLEVHLDNELAARLVARAKCEGRPKGHVVRAAIDAYPV